MVLRHILPVLLLSACAHAPAKTVTSTPAAAATGKSGSQVTLRQDHAGSIAAWTPVRGSRDAVVTIVEWSDFQCPFCGRSQATLKRLGDEYGDRLRLAFRHLPLEFHVHAQLAAEASMAAAAQGKFWEMHDRLFANQSELEPDQIEAAARALGLDMAAFDKAMHEHAYAMNVDADRQHAAAMNVRGTPTFFVNGQLLSGAQPYEVFHETIEKELLVAAELAKAGVAADQVYAVRLATTPAEKTEEPKEHPKARDLAPQKAQLAKWTPVRGPKLAKVTIVEYSDFQCPFCSRAADTMKALRDAYGDDLRIAYRHNPLPFHDHAREYADVSMAAQEQGKFWEMHDYLFAHQRELDGKTPDDLARAVGLDLPRFRRAMEKKAYARDIDEDIAEAARIGANGTPTFFINGRPLLGAQPLDVFRAAVDAERTNAQAMLDGGVPLKELYEKLLAKLPASPPTP